MYVVGLGDIEIQYYDSANKDIANIALEYLNDAYNIINICIMSKCYNNCTKNWSINKDC